MINTLKDTLSQELLDTANNVYWKDGQHQYLGCNETFCDFLNLSNSSEIMRYNDKTIANFLKNYNYMHDLYNKNDRAALASKCSRFSIEYYSDKSMNIFDWLTIKKPVFIDNEKRIGVLGVSIFAHRNTFHELIKNLLLCADILNLNIEPIMMNKIAAIANRAHTSTLKKFSNLKYYEYGEIYFTKREAQCMHFLLKNYSAKKTALKLSISKKTVEHYIAKLKEKLDCTTREAINEKAMTLGFIDLIFRDINSI